MKATEFSAQRSIYLGQFVGLVKLSWWRWHECFFFFNYENFHTIKYRIVLRIKVFHYISSLFYLTGFGDEIFLRGEIMKGMNMDERSVMSSTVGLVP